MQALRIKRVMLQFQDVIYLFCQKYTLTSRLRGGGQDLELGSTFRIDFSIWV